MKQRERGGLDRGARVLAVRLRALRPARVLTVLLLVALAARDVAAHPLDLGYLRVRQTGSAVAVTLDLDAGAAALLLATRAPDVKGPGSNPGPGPNAVGAGSNPGPGPNAVESGSSPGPAVDAAAVQAGAATLAAATYARAPITTAAGPCTWGAATAKLVGKTVTVASTATCPGEGERRWTFPFVLEQKISAKFELLVKEAVGESERLTLIDPSKTELVLATAADPAPKRSSRVVIWVVISALGVGAFCAILLRWRRRRTTSTT